MICVDFASFRARFATRAVMSMPRNFEFDNLPGDIHYINSFNFVWDAATPPFIPGMTLIMNGSALGNDTYTILSLQPAGFLCYVVETVTTEGAVAMSLCEGVTFDKSAWEEWPVEYMRVGDTAAAFAGGITGFASTPYDGDAFILTCNAAAADAVYGTDEYDWYLSQRTDDAASQYLSIAQGPDGGGPWPAPQLSWSGACVITPTALAESKFGFTVGAATPIDPDVTRMLFRSCDLYVRRISDQAIQRADMLLKVTGN